MSGMALYQAGPPTCSHVINVNKPPGKTQRTFDKSKTQMQQNYENADKTTEIGAKRIYSRKKSQRSEAQYKNTK